MVDISIKLDRADRWYYAGDIVSGVVVVSSDSRISHNGIVLSVEGTTSLQLSARSVGLFEAFYQNLPAIDLLSYSIPISGSNKHKILKGLTEYPFEFALKPLKNKKLYETYHGVYINIQYTIAVEMQRGMLSKNIKHAMEFYVKTRSKRIRRNRVSFSITPQALKNVQKQNTSLIPNFLIEGHFDSGVCNIEQPFTGELIVKQCAQEIKSIELQFVRVETCTYQDNEIREATEVQNIQLADGNICKEFPLAIYMIFPRLFTSVTTINLDFKIEFEVNVVVLFKDTHMLTENFPIKLVRNKTHLKF